MAESEDIVEVAGPEGPVIFRKNSYSIRVSDEVMMDAGVIGPRYRSIPERARWTNAWKLWKHDQASAAIREAQGGLVWFDTSWMYGWSAPPWEYWDKPAIPATFVLLPRLEALARVVARVRARLTEARRRVRRAWLALKGWDPDAPPDD